MTLEDERGMRGGIGKGVSSFVRSILESHVVLSCSLTDPRPSKFSVAVSSGCSVRLVKKKNSPDGHDSFTSGMYEACMCRDSIQPRLTPTYVSNDDTMKMDVRAMSSS